MARKHFTAEQIITKLREAEVELSKGQLPAEVCRRLGVTEQTYYRWRKDVLQLSKISKRATGWVDRAPSYAATSNSLLMN